MGVGGMRVGWRGGGLGGEGELGAGHRGRGRLWQVFAGRKGCGGWGDSLSSCWGVGVLRFSWGLAGVHGGVFGKWVSWVWACRGHGGIKGELERGG